MTAEARRICGAGPVAHSSLDLLESVQPDDLKEAAVVLAALVYNTAMRDERLPRRALAIPVE
jgi:hypothetical protein